jgi:hypothetical protein
MTSTHKHPALRTLGIPIVLFLIATTSAVVAKCQGGPCPKNDLGVFTTAESGFERGAGPNALDLSVGYCAIAIKYMEELDSSSNVAGIWPRDSALAPILLTRSNITIGNLKVPAGKYSLYLAAVQNSWEPIINKETSATAPYDESKDLGRIVLSDLAAPDPVSNKLSIAFTGIKGNNCSGRCDPKNGPFLARGELGQPQINFAWGAHHVFANIRQAPEPAPSDSR